ncbi:aminotransferase class I/II-fold pyridoxal phosphate-dependent enzyme [Candidatus Woesearchaeota archaeon]|nr:aminotransferase class I/II-fold pyridoxal phosphate-dependent enzyme [Candidatus Woesearchaeota archaeon]
MRNLSPSMFIGVAGKGVLSFGSGQPDLPPPTEVYSCLANYKAFKYGLIAGETNLREALAKEYRGYTKDNFIITNGASEALDLVIRAVGKPNDNVLLHTPYYYSYRPLVEMNYRKPLFVRTYKGKIDIDDFEENVHKAKAVLINSPSNPTGRIQEIKTLKIIEKMTDDLNIPLISDEVYKDLIYERENYMLSGRHVITINSFSKTFSMCGLRIGYLFSNDKSLVQKIIDMKSHTSMNTSIITQEMAYRATKVPRSFVKSQVRIWKERRNIIYRGMTELGLDLWKPEGAFYVLPKIKKPRNFVWDMFKKHKVITYLGEWFGAPERVRFSYALDTDKIEEGLKRVKKYLEKR